MRTLTSPSRTLLAAAAIALLGLAAWSFSSRAHPRVSARSGGFAGYSGNPATNDGRDCSQCHLGGNEPTVAIEGPDRLAPGETGSYQMIVAGGQGVQAGLDVSVTSGELGVPDGSVEVRLTSSEIVHVAPKPVDQEAMAIFEFLFTAPSQEGSVMLYGAGNSVNGDGRTSGDLPSTTTLGITVTGAQVTASPEPSATDTPEATMTSPVSPTSTASPEPTAKPTSTPDSGWYIYFPDSRRNHAASGNPTSVPTREPPTATPTNTSSPTITPTPSVTPTASDTPEPTITPTPSNTPTVTNTPAPTETPTPQPALLRIGFLKCDSRNEYVRVDNIGGGAASMRGWDILSVVGPQTYSFPNYTLEPGESVYVHSGPDASATGGNRLRWTTAYIWNNDGDTAELINPSGQVVDDDDC